MKTFICAILLCTTLCACTEKTSTDIPPTTDTIVVEEASDTKEYDFSDQRLGIAFDYDIYGSAGLEKVNVVDNKIFGRYEEVYIEVFKKEDDQTIEESILEIIQAKGADPEKCYVQKGGPQHKTIERFYIDLVDTTQDKDNFYQYHTTLQETCSKYASYPRFFIGRGSYGEFRYEGGKTFIFTSEQLDRPFFDEESIEILD